MAWGPKTFKLGGRAKRPKPWSDATERFNGEGEAYITIAFSPARGGWEDIAPDTIQLQVHPGDNLVSAPSRKRGYAPCICGEMPADPVHGGPTKTHWYRKGTL